MEHNFYSIVTKMMDVTHEDFDKTLQMLIDGFYEDDSLNFGDEFIWEKDSKYPISSKFMDALIRFQRRKAIDDILADLKSLPNP